MHLAIDGTSLKISSTIISDILKGKCNEFFPHLSGKKGKLFSNITLQKFIEEEALHDNFTLTEGSRRSIRTFSSGEQRKALLKHLLAQNLDFLIVDNPFDTLDVQSVEEMRNKLIELSKKMPIIQIFKRKNDLLPFISHIAHIKNDKLNTIEPIDLYLKQKETDNSQFLCGTIPPPYEYFDNQYEELISFNNVNVSYQDRKILDNISLKIKPGEFWHLVGPNGSGKTTILTMINGDNPKAFGQNIKLFGKQKGTGESVWQIKKKIGYFTPSMMDLYKHRHTSLQMIVSGLTDSIGVYKKTGSLQLKLAKEWLKLLGIYQKKDITFIKLSQIERRMILIARAMIKHPPLLILDEPSTGLDDKSAAMMCALINKMAAEGNTAILYVSHRKEADLKPQFIYELIPASSGSIGKINNT